MRTDDSLFGDAEAATVRQLEDVAPGELRRRCQMAVEAGARMQFVYAWFPEPSYEPELRYVVHASAGRPPQVWRCRPGQEPPPSLAPIAPLLSWHEREITDLCGLHFTDQPQPEPLVLLPGASFERPPLFPGPAAPLRYTPAGHTLPEVAGAAPQDVQLLPFGST